MRSFNDRCHNRDFLTPPAQRTRPAYACSVFVCTLIVAGSIEARIVALPEKMAALDEGIPGNDEAAPEKFGQTGQAALFEPPGGTTAGLPSAAPLTVTTDTASGVGCVGVTIAALQHVAQLGP
jgi:hypothetical protein